MLNDEQQDIEVDTDLLILRLRTLQIATLIIGLLLTIGIPYLANQHQLTELGDHGWDAIIAGLLFIFVSAITGLRANSIRNRV